VASAQAGIAFLAVHSGAPVVPVAILGTRPTGKSVGHVPRLRSRVYVVFGEPFRATDGGAGTGRAALQAAMETIQARLSAHVDAAAGLTGIGLPEEVGAAAAEETRTLRGRGPQSSWGHEITVTRRVAAPPDVVWSVLTDLEGAERTLRGVKKIQVLTSGGYDVGTRWRETRTMWGKEETEEMEVTVAEAPTRTVVEANPGGVRYTTTFSLRPAGSGTQVDVRFAAVSESPGRWEKVLWRVFGPLGAVASRKALEKDLEDIAVESSKRASRH
jgi:carbon monoxide dehydrogenase subunit G